MSNETAAQLASDALRALLLAQLPAQVSARNLLRAASITTPSVGPWIVPVDGAISFTVDGTAYTAALLTAGSRTAAELALELNTAMGGSAFTALTDGRLRFTSPTPPSSPTTNSVVGFAADATGALAVLGFDPAGEQVARSPLIAPTNQGVMDGEPTVLPPLANGRMIIVVGDRRDEEVQLRRDERLARLELRVYVPMATQNFHASREEIQSACACILNVLNTTAGRQFGRSADNDVGFTQVKSIEVSGSAWKTPNDLSYLFDQARLIVTARVFQRANLT